MALFRSRSFGRDTENRRNPVGSAESVESMRRRARHRLIGAAVLVAAGVVGFPMLFDTQPRPVAADVPIEIPERNQAAAANPPALAVTPPASGAAGLAVAPPAARTSVAAASAMRDPVVAAKSAPAATDGKGEVRKSEPAAPVESMPEPDPSAERTAKSSADKPAEKPAASLPEKARTAERESNKPASKPNVTAAVTPPERLGPKPPSRDDLRIAKLEEAARVRALLQGKSEKEAAVAAASVGRRYIVQIGAFSEPERARVARSKAERAGIKTFTQETKIGADTWIRVRVGPFATRAEADDAASKIKGLSLPASILTM